VECPSFRSGMKGTPKPKATPHMPCTHQSALCGPYPAQVIEVKEAEARLTMGGTPGEGVLL
jgi:hypothetical protein